MHLDHEKVLKFYLPDFLTLNWELVTQRNGDHWVLCSDGFMAVAAAARILSFCGLYSSSVRPDVQVSNSSETSCLVSLPWPWEWCPSRMSCDLILTTLWLLFSYPSPLLFPTWSTFSESLISKKISILTSHMSRHNITFLKTSKLPAHVFLHPKLLVRRLKSVVFFFPL